jgi:hypothetical protein
MKALRFWTSRVPAVNKPLLQERRALQPPQQGGEAQGEEGEGPQGQLQLSWSLDAGEARRQCT